MKTSIHYILSCIICMSVFCNAGELTVGPGKMHARIEEALALAQQGDIITVYPLPDNSSYARVALYVTKPGITIRSSDASRHIRLSGEDFDYSGHGSTPRAIVQFNHGSDGSVLEGFQLTGAHNSSHNGAGVRINQANDITIRNCEIYGNDMGIMSNGNGASYSGRNQRIEKCLIHHNGNLSDPGYNHNLYIGGESFTLIDSEVHSSLTGHNIKSRAHLSLIIKCYIHDSSNREIDLVDHKDDTSRPGSDAVITQCVIVKDKKCSGNRGVIHFGQDNGGVRNGTLYLVCNTIITPFISPVVLTSADLSRIKISHNIICDGGVGQQNQVLEESLMDISEPHLVFLSNNWLSSGFSGSTAKRGEMPPFRDPANGDYTLRDNSPEFLDMGAQVTPPAEIIKLIESSPDHL